MPQIVIFLLSFVVILKTCEWANVAISLIALPPSPKWKNSHVCIPPPPPTASEDFNRGRPLQAFSGECPLLVVAGDLFLVVGVTQVFLFQMVSMP